MEKLVRVDIDELIALYKGERLKKFEGKDNLKRLFMQLCLRMQGDIRHPYWDGSVFRMEFWRDNIKIFARCYRPKPEHWPGHKRIIYLDYPIHEMEG